MSDIDPGQVIHTRIWKEEPEPDNPFATRAAYCRGYDVFGEMVGNARWVEMLYLLFKQELPGDSQLDMLEALAVALANPGPRDPSVHAAMCGGVGGSTAAASLIAALAVGAGRHGGARDVFDAMEMWIGNGTDLQSWANSRTACVQEGVDVWPSKEHTPGFESDGVSTSTVVVQLADKLARCGKTPCIMWLNDYLQELSNAIGLPLTIAGVAAAALVDLGFTPKEGEMLYLLLRLPGAAAHALEQEAYGYRRFPFYPVTLDEAPQGADA